MGRQMACVKCEYGTTYEQHRKAEAKLVKEAEQICKNRSEFNHGLDDRPYWLSAEFESEEEAWEFLEKYNDWDGAWGCTYKVYDKKENKKSESLKKKYYELKDKYDAMKHDFYAYAKKSDIKLHKSAYIGCPKCGSKLNKDYLKLESWDRYDFDKKVTTYRCRQLCPLCATNLLSPTIQARVQKYDEDLIALEKQCRVAWNAIEEAKKTGKYKLMLMLKFDYRI